MPSADMCTMSNGNPTNNMNPLPIRGPEFNISSKDVEGLVLEIKENLRLSASSFKAIPCSHISRKSSRASPYRVPGRVCSCENACDINRKNKRKLQHDANPDDPYEFLQKLLRDGSLVNEAVRRVQLGLTPKQRYFYESEEEFNSPKIFNFSINLQSAYKPTNMFKAPGSLWMGEGTHRISMELFAFNRERLVKRLRAKDNVPNKGMIFLQGGSEVKFYNTDTNYVFRQESFFMWTFGVVEPDCYGAIDIDTGKTYLFVPRLPPDYAIWMGPLHTLQDFSAKYSIENVHYVDQMPQLLTEINPFLLFLLNGVNSDSDESTKLPAFPGLDKFNINISLLHDEMADLRVIKTEKEIEVLRYVIAISSEAHRKVMRLAKPGMYEYQCESCFLDYIYGDGGCRHVSYTCICGSGHNSSILHYGHAGAPNAKQMKAGDMCLFDMGGNYFGYAADITCTFPVNKKFTEQQKFIYNAVLSANLTVQNKARPGSNWLDMHLLANLVLLEKLKEGGLLIGDVNKMISKGLANIFQPHGLGHLLGLDVHDVGGYLPHYPRRSEHVKALRTCRDLEPGMVLTIEPGCYFIDCLLDKAINSPELSKFLNIEKLQTFRGFGGVRIEDNVLVTENGIENLTKVPRTVAEIEEWLALGGEEKYN